MNRGRIPSALLAILIALPAATRAQTNIAAPIDPSRRSQALEPRPPREFPEFRGPWMLDEGAGKGYIAGLPVARRLTIATTPTELSLTKDGAAPESYRFDGSETPSQSGEVRSLFSYRMTLVGDAIALTTRRVRPNGTETLTNVITDAYTVSGDVLTIERSLSVVRTPPGVVVTLSDPRNNRQTLVYRRTTTAR